MESWHKWSASLVHSFSPSNTYFQNDFAFPSHALLAWEQLGYVLGFKLNHVFWLKIREGCFTNESFAGTSLQSPVSGNTFWWWDARQLNEDCTHLTLLMHLRGYVFSLFKIASYRLIGQVFSSVRLLRHRDGLLWSTWGGSHPQAGLLLFWSWLPGWILAHSCSMQKSCTHMSRTAPGSHLERQKSDTLKKNFFLTTILKMNIRTLNM